MSEKIDVERKVIPLGWFCTFQDKGGSILTIDFSPEFHRLANGEVERCLENWMHRRVSPGKNRNPKDLLISVLEMRSADMFIFQHTGFHAEQIVEKYVSLNNQYKGQLNSPLQKQIY